MSLSRSSEGHARRASPMPDPDQPTIRERVLTDLAVHAGAFTVEIAARTELTVPQVSGALSVARLRGEVVRRGDCHAYQWALPGAMFEIRPMPPRNYTGPTWARERMEREIEAIAAFAAKRHPSRVGAVDVAIEFRTCRRTAERRLAQCAERNLLVLVYRHGKSTGRYRLPEPGEFEHVPGVADNDPGAPPAPGDCHGGGR